MGAGCDGIHPKVPLDFSVPWCKEVAGLIEKVHPCVLWPQQACTTRFSFLIPEHITSKRPIAFLPIMIRWWDGLREREVKKWQVNCRVDWSATDGRSGGDERTAWKALLEVARIGHGADKWDQRATTLMVDLTKGCGRVSSPVVWAWATHFHLSSRILRVLCGCFQHLGREGRSCFQKRRRRGGNAM